MIRPSENSPRARAALLPCHSPSPPPLVVSLVVNFAPANCRAFRPAICGLREGGRREEEPRGSARPQKSGYNGQERRARSPLPPPPPAVAAAADYSDGDTISGPRCEKMRPVRPSARDREDRKEEETRKTRTGAGDSFRGGGGRGDETRGGHAGKEIA